ncbi:MAG: alpha/beta hydrolase [Pseudomonadota bacterium]
MTLPQTVAAALIASFIAWPSADAQTIELADCRINAGAAYPSIKARCGTFTRPLDPANPDTGSIDLNVAVVPALSLKPESDPLVPIAGGPGQGSIEFYAATAQAFEAIRRDRDILLVDQRGTGDSARMDCDVDETIVSGRMSAAQTREATLACIETLPHDPRFFTTSVAVGDLDALREALGYTALNLYGVSYGSRVAQHFAKRYPDTTRSVILDGVVPPQLALGPAIAPEAQRALDAIFDRCAEDAACADRYPNVGERFLLLQNELEAAAVSVTLPHPVHGGSETVEFGRDELAMTVRLLSYHPTTVALIPFLLDEATSNNLTPLVAQYLSISSSLADTLSIGMHNAVACTEDAPYFAAENVTRDSLERTYIGPVLLEALTAICSVWPAGVLDEGFKEPLATAAPVLLLSGEADPITPPEYASQAAVDLRTAYLHTGALQGHGQAARGCMPEVMAEFVATPSESPIDDDCLSRTFAMPFFLGYSGPAP